MSAIRVYVSSADSRDISVLGFDAATATLTPLQTLPLPGIVMPLALSPDRRHLYAALRSEPFGVASLRIDPHDGTLTLQAINPLPQSMANMTTDRSGRHLFATSYGGDCLSVSSIAADGVAGAAPQVLPTGRNAHAAIVDPAVMQFHFDAASGAVTPNTPPPFAAHAGEVARMDVGRNPNSVETLALA